MAPNGGAAKWWIMDGRGLSSQQESLESMKETQWHLRVERVVCLGGEAREGVDFG